MKFSAPLPNPADQLPALDRAGVITNRVLGILYLSLALFFSFAGMVSDGFIDSQTALQNLLCNTVMIFGVLTVPVCAASILASVFLRRRGRSALSFAVQFAGLVWMLLILLLLLLLEIV